MRVDGWPEILNEYARMAEEIDFQWGEYDCCTFVFDFVEMVTGIDHIKKYRGKYKNAKGAYSALKKYGKGNISETVDTMLSPINIPFAMRGDIVLYETEIGDALGLCLGEKSVFLAPSGSVKVRTLDCKRAWRVE